MYKAFKVICFFIAIYFFGCKSKKTAEGNTIAPAAGQPSAAVGLHPGNQAPEISLRDPNDSLIPLSSLRGKMVLIDFWASWCGPCRLENPAVVAAYQKFKDEKFKDGNSFTVYSVSLDLDRNKWRSAIKKDGLSWPYHVSDLKFWESEAAKMYKVEGIPYSVLINGKGQIVAKNLRGEDLEHTLNKLKLENK